MKLVIGTDTAGYDLKEAVLAYLDAQGIEYDDVGDLTPDQAKPYYITASEAAQGIQKGIYDRGILFCGTGMGMSIVANKHRGIYASCVESLFAAEKCRAINKANILCMGGFIVGPRMGIEMVKKYLATEFLGGFEDDPALTNFLINAFNDIDDMDKDLTK